MLERYNASGPEALANGRRRNGLKPSLLTAEVLEMVRLRLAEPPPDGGLWSSRKVAEIIAAHLGLERVLPQRGWEVLEALGYTLQRPRPREPEVRHLRRGGRAQKTYGPPRRQVVFSVSGLNCLHKRIRPSGKPLAKMESRASWSS